jgi:TP901 family phage tail tape measure protein
MPIQIPVTQTGFEASIQAAAQKAGRNLKIDLGSNARSINALSQPLGRITGQADEFTKSMEAANARVLAFGASVGVLNSVIQGFKSLVATTIEVEKSLADINSVLQGSGAQLNKFKKDIFDVARETGNSFKTVSEAALELSRQGLPANEVVTRLKDSMILARLSGLDAAQSVEGLTAAVNSFSKEGLTSSQVLNKISNAAAKYAVSERDLIEGFKRSASVAQQAGVSIDELGGIITAVQQKSARGGAVIGNSFKTIFTRIQRPESLKLLEEIGVKVLDLKGNVVPATKLLEGLASKISGLNDVEVASITEKIGGGFQIAPLLSALDDYSSKASVARGATEAFLNAGTEAYQRNAALNQTMAAAINEASVNLKEFANTLGEIGVTKGLSNVLSFFNTFISDVQGLLEGEGLGSKFARSIVEGIGNVLSGPGLAIFGGIILKLTTDLVKFGTQSLKTFFNIGSAAKEINTLQGSIASTLLRNKDIQAQILALEGNRAAQARFFTTALNEQYSTMQKMQNIAASIAPAVYGGTVSTKKSSGKNAAGGYMPAISQESRDISRGVGGARGGDRPVVIPNFAFGGGKKGTMVAHTGEYIVPNFARGGSAIFNRDMIASMGLPSGAQKIGAAGGFIPNFVTSSEDEAKIQARIAEMKADKDYNFTPKKLRGKLDANIPYIEKEAARRLLKEKEYKEASVINAASIIGPLPTVLAPLGAASIGGMKLRKNYGNDKIDFAFSGYTLNQGGLDSLQKEFEANFANDSIKTFAKTTALQAAQQIAGAVQADPVAPSSIDEISDTDVKGFLSSVRGAFGGIFDAAVTTALKIKAGNDKTKGDFDVRGLNTQQQKWVQKLFGEAALPSSGLADFKIGFSDTTTKSMVDKTIKEYAPKINNYIEERDLKTGAVNKADIKTGSKGFIPNFAKYIYDSDRIAPDKGATLKAVLASQVKKNLIIGPAGSGKSTLAGKMGKFLSGVGDVANASEIDILSGAARAKGGGISKNLEAIISAVNGSGGKVSYLYAKNLDILSRRAGRTVAEEGDLRSKKQLKGTTYAPLNQFDFMGYVKSKSRNFNLVNGAKGFIPNFADPLKEAIGREMSAGVPASQIYVDQNSSLKNSMNPMGLMVANRRDEPAGGIQGINRARKEGANPMLYGAADGFIPNYAPQLGEATRSDMGRTRISDQAITDFNNSLKGVSDQLRKGSISFADANLKVDQLAKSTGSTQAQVMKLGAVGQGLITAYNNELQARNQKAKELKEQRAGRSTETAGSKGPRDMLGTLFAVQAGLSLLTGATNDSSSSLVKFTNIVSQGAGTFTTAMFAIQGLAGMGGKLGAVFSKLGPYGIAAAATFSAFQVADGLINEFSGANKLAAENSAKLAKAAGEAAVKLEDLDPVKQQKVKQTSANFLYNLQNRQVSLETGQYVKPENRYTGGGADVVLNITDEEEQNLAKAIEIATLKGATESQIGKIFTDNLKQNLSTTGIWKEEASKIQQALLSIRGIDEEVLKQQLFGSYDLEKLKQVQSNSEEINKLAYDNKTTVFTINRLLEDQIDLIEKKSKAEKTANEEQEQALSRALQDSLKKSALERPTKTMQQAGSLLESSLEISNKQKLLQITGDLSISEDLRKQRLEEVNHQYEISKIGLQNQVKLAKELDSSLEKISSGDILGFGQNSEQATKQAKDFIKKFTSDPNNQNAIEDLLAGNKDQGFIDKLRSQVQIGANLFDTPGKQDELIRIITEYYKLTQDVTLEEKTQINNKQKLFEISQKELSIEKQRQNLIEKGNLYIKTAQSRLTGRIEDISNESQLNEARKNLEIKRFEKTGKTVDPRENERIIESINEKYFKLQQDLNDQKAEAEIKLEITRGLKIDDNITSLGANTTAIGSVQDALINNILPVLNTLPKNMAEQLKNAVLGLNNGGQAVPQTTQAGYSAGNINNSGLSQGLMDFVKKQEGFKAGAYSDYGQMSIGYGTKAKIGELGTISEEEASNRLAEELKSHADRIENAAKEYGITLNQNQKDALTSFDYNTGKGVNLLSRFKGEFESSFQALGSKMLEYNKAGGEFLFGLAERRKKEVAIFNAPVTTANNNSQLSQSIDNLRLDLAGKDRNEAPNQDLQDKIRRIVAETYGPSAIATIYSGMGYTPGGSRRHETEEGGKAADIYVEIDGKKVTGEELAKLGARWVTGGYGSAGYGMDHQGVRGSGIHLDTFTKDQLKSGEGLSWGYGGQTGSMLKNLISRMGGEPGVSASALANQTLSQTNPIYQAGERISGISDSTSRTESALEEAKKLVDRTGKSDEEIKKKINEIANQIIAASDAIISKGKTKTTADALNQLSKQNTKLEAQPGTFASGFTTGMENINKEIAGFSEQIGEKVPALFADNMAKAMEDAILNSEDLETSLRSAATAFLTEINRSNFKNLANIFTSGLQQAGSSIFSSFTQRASGGPITGGSGTKDDVPALLMGGEFVMNKKSVSKYGMNFMNQLNNGNLPKFAKGGSVEEISDISKIGKQTIFSGKVGSEIVGQYDEGKAPRQVATGGGFYSPGMYGSGSIIGKADLLAFATQSQTSGAKDVIMNEDKLAYASLEPESARLTVSGRMNSPEFQAVQKDKEEAFNLYLQQLNQEQALKEKEKAEKKAFRKAWQTALWTTVASSVISAIAQPAMAGFQAGMGQAASQNLTGFQALGSGFKGIWSGGNFAGTQIGGLSNFFSGNNQLANIGTVSQLSSLYQSNPNSDLGKLIASNASNYISGISVPKAITVNRATGGLIPNTSGTDTTQAMLSGGEFIMNRAATQNIGVGALQSLNAGGGQNSTESADKIVSKLDELIAAIKENMSGNISVNVNSNAASEKETADSSSSGNNSESSNMLKKKIKAAVMEVIQQEKRLGGSLRFTQ